LEPKTALRPRTVACGKGAGDDQGHPRRSGREPRPHFGVSHSEHLNGDCRGRQHVTFRVDDELKAAFAAVAAAQEHTAAQLLRLLMRDTVKQWQDAQAHDTWFRS
jgi:hypothetical protein